MSATAAQGPAPAVFVEEKPAAGTRHEVRAGTTVGREGCDIVLADPQASRRHAAFRDTGAGIGVEDLGSRNGTFVNDRRVTGLTAVSVGDTVRFGETVWRLETAPAAERTVVAPARGPVAAPMPSGLHRAAQAEVMGEAPQFEPGRQPSPILGGSAARMLTATVLCYLVIAATAVAIAIYFAYR